MPLRSPIRPPQGTPASMDRLAPADISSTLPAAPVIESGPGPERLVYVTCPVAQVHGCRIREVTRGPGSGRVGIRGHVAWIYDAAADRPVAQGKRAVDWL